MRFVAHFFVFILGIFMFLFDSLPFGQSVVSPIQMELTNIIPFIANSRQPDTFALLRSAVCHNKGRGKTYGMDVAETLKMVWLAAGI